jgi:predicted kinase
MEAVIFIGIPGSGKSTFYRQRFFDTHVRISLDLLRTRHRERRLLEACLATQQRFVIDNTNVTRAARAPYIAAARTAGFAIVGYYFQAEVDACLLRNQSRPASRVVPRAGVLGKYQQLELPRLDEGFAALFYVRIDPTGEFVVEAWKEEGPSTQAPTVQPH